MNECRKNAAAAVVNGKIYCCGGYNGKKHLNSVEYYDPPSDLWTRICDMPGACSALCAAVMDRTLIVIGGLNDNEGLNSVWTLDTVDESAEWIESSFMSDSRSYFSSAKIDGQIFVCGGASGPWVISDVKIFDGEDWRNGPKLAAPLKCSAAIVIPIDFATSLKMIC